MLFSALSDLGFHGRGRLAVSVGGVDVLEIEQNAAVAQLVFLRTRTGTTGFAYNDPRRLDDTGWARSSGARPIAPQQSNVDISHRWPSY
jgi:hypothetical protein